jgi:hypothetical protein
VRIKLDAPVDSLSPLDDRVANLTLIVDGAPGGPEIQTVAVGPHGAALALGDVPIAKGLSVSMLATSAGARMIGYGRGENVLDVKEGEEATVTVRMRRPFAYVAGAAKLSAFDTTLEPRQTYLSTLEPVTSAPAAVAASPDGSDVAIADGTRVTLASTADHTTVTGQVDVGGAATDLAYTPDGRTLVVAVGGGVALVDVAAAHAGVGQAVQVAVGQTARVAASSTTAWALVAGWDDNGCGASQVVPIDLTSMTAGAPVIADRAVADLAVEPRSGTLLVALPCDGVGKVGVLSGTGAGAMLSQSFDVQGAMQVVVAGGRIYAAGRVQAPGGSHVVLASVGIDGSNMTHLDLPVPEERALSTEFDTNGQAAEVRINADGVRVLDMAVLPDGARVALIVSSSYHGDKTGDPGLLPFESIIPAIDLSTWEYQLLDVSTGVPLQRMRTRCVADWTHNSYLDNFQCTQAAGQDQAPTAFQPTRVTVLYGDR